jgi:glutamyl/glutaminyl-tRNA synthetase
MGAVGFAPDPAAGPAEGGVVAPGADAALVWTRAVLIDALPLFLARRRTLAVSAPAARYLKRRPAPDVEGLRKKVKRAEPAALAAALRQAADALAAQAGHADDEREAALRAVAESHALKPGDVFMGLRVAITGVTASPPILPSVDRVGTAESVARVRALADVLANVG